MKKRSSYEIKSKIILTIREKPTTYAKLERKLNTGYRTIKANCKELEQFGQVEIKTIKHPSNGKKAYIVSITKLGIRFLDKKKTEKGKQS